MNLQMDSVTLWLFGLTAVAVLNFVLAMILFVQKGRLRRQLKRWKSIHATADLDAIYHQTLQKVEEGQEQLARMKAHIKDLESALQTKVSTPRVLRYNAFAETGSDLSFSVAFVDDFQTGIVLSSIYGREESRTYGKPVFEGRSSYLLTEEEQDVLHGEHAQRRQKAPV